MDEVRVETGVDDLIQYLKEHGKSSLKEVADALKIKESYIQAWVDFLIEENILGVEYKFTKPYLFLNDTHAADTLQDNIEEDVEKRGILALKEEYFRHGKEKKLPDDKLEKLWRQHLRDALEKRKDYFFREAQKRNLDNAQELYDNYKMTLEKV